jgi:hypothetical protein
MDRRALHVSVEGRRVDKKAGCLVAAGPLPTRSAALERPQTTIPLSKRRPIVRARQKSSAYDGPLSGGDGNAPRTTEILRVRRPIVRRRWKCAAYDRDPPRTTAHCPETMEMRCVRLKSSAYDGPLSGDDGNAPRTTEILRVRRPIVWRQWKCAAYDGPLEGGMTTIPPSVEPSSGDDGDALRPPVRRWQIRRDGWGVDAL